MITVVAVFESFEPAQSAKNALLVSGFTWRQVQLSPDHEVVARERSATPQPGDQSVNATVGNLVRGLFGFGNRSAHGDLYGAAVRHGDYVVVVDVDTGPQRERAEDILRRHGPVELSHRST